MHHDYFSVERYMQERQRELLSAARHARQSQAAARITRARRAAERRQVRFPTPFAFALDEPGRALVTAGHRLEYGAAGAAARKAAGLCDEQPTAAGC